MAEGWTYENQYPAAFIEKRVDDGLQRTAKIKLPKHCKCLGPAFSEGLDLWNVVSCNVVFSVSTGKDSSAGD